MPRPVRTTPETIQQMKALYLAGGITLREISDRFHHAPSTVRALLIAEGVKIRHGAERFFNNDELCAEYNAGATQKALGLKYNCDSATIRKALVVAGATIRDEWIRTPTGTIKHRIPDELIPELVKLYQEGASVSEVAQQAGAAIQTVYRAFSKHGVVMRPRGPTPTEHTLRNRRILALYGLTSQQYAEKLTAQGGGCAICGRSPSEKQPLFVDHCHVSGAVRDLLCQWCNTVLGYASDDAARLMSAANYLRRHSARTGQPTSTI